MNERFVVCETVSGRYVCGKGRDGEAVLFLVNHAQCATRLSRENALALAASLPALGLKGSFAVEEVG